METDRFDFELPEHLIAQNPAEKRSDSRLLVYYREEDRIVDSRVSEVANFLDSDTFLVFNNSRVISSRVDVRKKENDRPGEFLVLKIEDSHNVVVLTDKSKKYKAGTEVLFPDGREVVVKEDIDNLTKRVFSEEPLFSVEYFEQYGSIPLPPYIDKKPGDFDKERYQTVYSKIYGSAAAPTAGLHFDEQVFSNLDARGVGHAFVTLHVGLGTFQPIYADNIHDHKIHEEEYFIDPAEAERLNRAVKEGKRIIPVGTTSMRTLETAFHDGAVPAGTGKSSLYIYPGYDFKVAGGLFTNFHTPKSSLLVLVSAILGVDKLFELYDYAIKNEYRFFSYGDAMLIL